MSKKLYLFGFTLHLRSRDPDKNLWSNGQNCIGTHWDSFVSIYYFTCFTTFEDKNDVECDCEKCKQCHVTLFVLVWHVEIQLDLLKATSAANHASVLSLLEQGHSVRNIERRTGLGKSTVGRIKKGVDTGKENNHGGRPSKLSARDKTSIICQIQSGKLL